MIFTGSTGSALFAFDSDDVPQVFKHLEEVRRSLVRLCKQRDRLKKEVRALSAKVTKLTTTEDHRSTAQANDYQKFIWVKKESVNQFYTEKPSIINKKKRNHRGHRKKRQDINSIVARCLSTFKSLVPLAQPLPSILAKLPTLLKSSFDEFYFLFDFFMTTKQCVSNTDFMNLVNKSFPP